MEALRLTMNSARLMPIIDLPPALRNREVDVIVMSKSEEVKERPHNPERANPKRESMMGCLSEYAKHAISSPTKCETIRCILGKRNELPTTCRQRALIRQSRGRKVAKTIATFRLRL